MTELEEYLKSIKDAYGATHYSVMTDGVTPQMFYKKEPIHYNDNTSKLVWVYLSFANLWMGSNITRDSEHHLKEIK